MNLLLTSVGRRGYLVKYFKDVIGNNGIVHVSNSSAQSPAFSYADKSVVTPLIYDKEYIPFLLSYCKDNEIQMIIPLFDVDLPILSANKKLFKNKGVDVIVSNEDVIKICNDKYKTYKFLLENGFNSPKTFLSIDDALVAIDNGELFYPVIIKPRWGMGSIGLYQADNEFELNVLYHKTLESIKNSYLKYESLENITDCILIQEKLKGQEYGLDVINDLNGVHQNTVVKLKHAMRSGETDCAETVDNYELKTIGLQLSSRLRHIGNLDVDVFMMGNIPYILEMNARFGGGYPFSHVAGVNLPKALIYWVQGKEIPKLLLQEKYGVLSHKDIIIIQLNNLKYLSKENALNKISIVSIEQLNENNILDLLFEFNQVLKPSITEKVGNLEKYAKKLKEKACVYVARKEKNLGILAIYVNDHVDRIAYLTFLCVHSEARNQRIAQILFEKGFEKCQENKMRYIKLEVQKENLIAQGFYKKNGFTPLTEASEKSFYMIKKL